MDVAARFRAAGYRLAGTAGRAGKSVIRGGRATGNRVASDHTVRTDPATPPVGCFEEGPAAVTRRAVAASRQRIAVHAGLRRRIRGDRRTRRGRQDSRMRSDGWEISSGPWVPGSLATP